MLRALAVSIVLMLLTACASAPVRIPADYAGQRGQLAVFVFISTECPIANAMVPDLRQLAAEAKTGGIAFRVVHATPGVDDAAIAQHAREFGLEGAVDIVIDRDQSLVRALGATITPEAVLVRLDGAGGFERLYAGRVNDLYSGIGRRRANATSNDLRDAMHAARDGRPIARPWPVAVGCFIELRTPQQP